MQKYFVYIIYNIDHKKFYIGQTDSLKRRTEQHNVKNNSNKYAAKYSGRWVLVYREIFFNRTEARKRENFLKKQKNREFYIKLCRSQQSSG